MSKEVNVDVALAAFREQLANDILSWMAAQTPPIRQKELAVRLGVRPTTVNSNLRNHNTMSIGFIELISRTLPQFSYALRQYRELLDARMAPLEEAGRVVTKAAAIAEVRRAGEEVVAAVNGLVDAAVRLLDQK